jgi:hypothetical protein
VQNAVIIVHLYIDRIHLNKSNKLNHAYLFIYLFIQLSSPNRIASAVVVVAAARGCDWG